MSPVETKRNILLGGYFMKKLILLFVLLLLIITGCNNNNSIYGKVDGEKYTNEKYGFSMNIPKDWERIQIQKK